MKGITKRANSCELFRNLVRVSRKPFRGGRSRVFIGPQRGVGGGHASQPFRFGACPSSLRLSLKGMHPTPRRSLVTERDVQGNLLESIAGYFRAFRRFGALGCDVM